MPTQKTDDAGIVAGIVSAALAGERPSVFARAYGDTVKSGIATRNVLRTRLGVYVSQGDAFDGDVRARLLSHPAIAKRVIAHAVTMGASEDGARDAFAALTAAK